MHSAHCRVDKKNKKKIKNKNKIKPRSTYYFPGRVYFTVVTSMAVYLMVNLES